MRYRLVVSRVTKNLVDAEDEDGNVTPGPWRAEAGAIWEEVQIGGSNNYSSDARVIREEFKSYFNLEGAVPWQWRMCGLD